MSEDEEPRLYLLLHGGYARVVGAEDNWDYAFEMTGEAGRLFAAAPELLSALKQCREALLALSEDPAFEDDAPEFNKGGVGYEACRVAIETINKAEGRGE
jgi:hypothetical protein